MDIKYYLQNITHLFGKHWWYDSYFVDGEKFCAVCNKKRRA